MKQAWIWLVTWACIFGIYLLFAASVQSSEIIAGLAIAAGAAALYRYARSLGFVSFQPAAAWVIPFWRVPGAMAWETGLLIVALVKMLTGKHIQGAFIRFPYPAKAEGAVGASMRAISTFGVCITPNSYVIRIGRRSKQVLLHQLVGRQIARSDKEFLCLP